MPVTWNALQMSLVISNNEGTQGKERTRAGRTGGREEIRGEEIGTDKNGIGIELVGRG